MQQPGQMHAGTAPHMPLKHRSCPTRSNARDTATMARATDRFQLSAMRANLLQKCREPDFEAFDTCSASKHERNMNKLALNTVNLRHWHQVRRNGGGLCTRCAAEGLLLADPCC